MSVPDVERALIIELRSTGKTYKQIASELGIAHNTVWRCLRGNEMPAKVKKERNMYLKTLTEARHDLLDRVKAGVNDGSITDILKAFSALDQAYEREHKIMVGYYLSPEQQKKWLDQLIGVINQEVEDATVKQRIADRMAALSQVTK